MLRRVVHTFLQSGKSTEREDLLVEFENLNDLNDLGHRNIFRTLALGGTDYLPSAVAFHYCGDAKAEDQARKAVQLLAKVLRKQFLSRRVNLSREALEDDGRKIDPSCDLRTIELGIYLSPDFRLFQLYSGGNQGQPIITPGRISEQIVEIKNPDALWDDYMQTWKPWPTQDSTGGVTPATLPIPLQLDGDVVGVPEKKLTRDQKIALSIGIPGLLLTLVAIVIAITVPEARRLIGLDKPTPAPTENSGVAVTTLDGSPQNASKTSVPSNAPKVRVGRLDWHDKQNWRKHLSVGMSKESVRQLFGDPEKVSVTENLEEWDYGTGEIRFFGDSLYSWAEPD
jgi:hypothetical protein